MVPGFVLWHPRLFAAIAALGVGSGPVQALDITTGNPDLSVRFDNTVKASTIYRLTDADPALVDSFRLLVPGNPASAFPQALNQNAGNDNFRNRGFVSERVDLLSQLDLVYRRDFGFRISGVAWYDAKYHRRTDAIDSANGQTPIDEFPSRTRRISGGDGEVLDAFVFGGWDIGNGRRLTARLGRHALQYGETLFFGDNGIARAQGPIDIDKFLASPSAQFKEIIRPVGQLSGNLQLAPDLAVGGYYQLEWQEDRLPSAGSFFSPGNIPWGSSQPEFAGPLVLAAGDNVRPKGTGQFGMQLKWRLGESDLGLYAARFHDKDAQLYGNAVSGQYFWLFPTGVKTVGASVTRSFGDVNLSAEGSIRYNSPLRSTNMLSFTGVLPRYATGTTAHVNFSWLASLPPNLLAKESSFLGEIAWNRVLRTDDPDAQLDAGRTRDATAIQLLFTPTYRQVLTGLDINVPIGLRYTIDGASSVATWDARGVGSMTLGVQGNYLGQWQFSLNYTHYIGEAVPAVDYRQFANGGPIIYGRGNAFADRDNISLSLRRTF